MYFTDYKNLIFQIYFLENRLLYDEAKTFAFSLIPRPFIVLLSYIIENYDFL